MRLKILLSICSVFVFTHSVFAVPVKGKLPAGTSVMLIQDNGAADTSSARSFQVSSAKGKAKLYLLENGSLLAPVAVAVKYNKKYYSVADAIAKKTCKKSGAKLVMGLKVPATTLDVGAVKLNSARTFAYLKAAPNVKYLNTAALVSPTGNKTKCEPQGTGGTLGLSVPATSAVGAKSIHISADSDDADSDGLGNALDVDDDGDGIIDPYDTDTPAAPPSDGAVSSSFHIFSNLKAEIGQSLNAYTQTLTDSAIDTLVQNQATLAIEVAGGEDLPTELDCGGLGYCSSGGTGSPLQGGGQFPEDFDDDSDGIGTIEEGPTGDFQLRPGATSSQIGAGDTYLQIVTDPDTSVETQVPGMLSFIFNTTPAISSLVMDSQNFAPTYPSHEGIEGSANAPFIAPPSWDGVVEISAYRPQRRGISGAGEGSFVDIGNSLITIDIPNQPCSGSGGCSGNGPGNCTAEAYSETDGSLESDTNGLRDTREDRDTDTSDPTSNIVTFSIDLDACLAAAPGGAISWSSGQKLAIDLQFRNEVGDNAAQKFYIQKQ